jgi:tetratricopeptide (TPR) repeat protein
MDTLWTRSLLAALTLAVAASAARADIIELRDGRKISGSISREGKSVIIKGDDGATVTALPADVMSVTLTSSVTPQEAANAAWTRLALEIKKADDLQSIIALHQKFLEKFPGLPLTKEVQASMGVYQKLADNGGVKFRGHWIPRAQIEVTLKQWSEAAREATDRYKEGQLKEALESARGVLAKDDQNPDALTIAGLAAYRMNNLALARTYFTTLAAADPGSVLAENNLGVLSFQQKQLGEGLGHYTRALQAMPDHRLVLDNIAEALNTYLDGGGNKNTAAYRTLVRQFEPAELKKEAEMAKPTASAKAGWRRWGSTWVTPEQLSALEKYQQVVQDRMTQLDSQYKNAQQTLAGMDDQIKKAQADCENAIAALEYYNNQITALTQRAMDTVWATSQRDQSQAAYDQALQRRTALETAKTQLIASVGQAREQAGKLKSAAGSGSVAQYTGVQKIIDLGEVENPPPPAAAPAIPTLPAAPPIVVVQPPPEQPVAPPPAAPAYAPVLVLPGK